MAHNHVSSDRVPEFSLGERIRKAREDLGLSQQQFADQLDVDRKTVGNWEAMRNQPRYGDLMLIASVADVSLEWLAGDLFRRAVPEPRSSRIGRRSRALGDVVTSDNADETRRDTHEYATVAA